MSPILFAVGILILISLPYTSSSSSSAPPPSTIIHLPIDERYTTFNLFKNLASLTPSTVLTPPTDLLPSHKTPADTDELFSWLETSIISSASSTTTCIISVEMLLYGGLINSRESNTTTVEISARLSRLKSLTQKYPKITTYLSTVVMRIPAYNGDFEEPWYWADYGYDLYQYSYYLDKFSSSRDPADREMYEKYEDQVPQNIVQEFLWRRQRNHNLTKELLSMQEGEKPFEAIYTTLDDSGLYGLNVAEANDLKRLISDLQLSDDVVKIYQGADEVGASLLARSISDSQPQRPTARILWRNRESINLIPGYESVDLNTTTRNQLSAAGIDVLQEQDSTSVPDILYVVNNFDSEPQPEASQQTPTPSSDYSTILAAAVESSSVVAIADVRYANGGDISFVMDNLLSSALTQGSYAYAGWNTDGNAQGTACANAVLLHYYGKSTSTAAANRLFTLLRVTEDVLYQSLVRDELKDEVNVLGGDPNNLDQDLDYYQEFVYGKLSLQSLAEQLSVPYPAISSCYFPWNRTFEIGFHVDFTVDESPKTVVSCDVLIVGGSTAALAAALSAADDSPKSTVCLTEPTDWAGGQLTSSLISAIDFGENNRVEECLPTNFVDMLKAAGFPDNPRGCWVSTFCYEANVLMSQWIEPQLEKRENLNTIYNTVPVGVKVAGNTVTAVDFVSREAVPSSTPPPTFSSQIDDWYDPEDSASFSKTLMTIECDVVIDATEFGDVLVLSGASFMQGNEENELSLDSDTNDLCGQAIVFPFYLGELDEGEIDLDDLPRDEPPYSLDGFPWTSVWSYRRVSPTKSLMAWGGEKGDGNDYAGSYHFLSVEDTISQRDGGTGWRGGLDVETLKKAEDYSLGFADWYLDQVPSDFAFDPAILTGDESSGTGSGLSKMPYIRDTRRSIGIDGFWLTSGDLSSGMQVPDSIGIGDYLYFDEHSVQGCELQFNGTLQPYQIPLRALTNQDFDNLLAAGKTMAQSNAANAATRLHPMEWVVGTAAGILASEVLERGEVKAIVKECMGEELCDVQKRVGEISPLDWQCSVSNKYNSKNK
ncbi:hypothetical protein TrVE_jg10391 [Triparma verrucosa]|uniref:Uncharacterized protein n=1 Tax=Triparma verrucosa TaxID=1606542 RepID=A0A9W7FCC9_9STRA|nr:hypothetical protein TrVE_jg10391 [Triparma verrucosa]